MSGETAGSSVCICKWQSRSCPGNRAILLTLLISSLERVGTYISVSNVPTLLKHVPPVYTGVIVQVFFDVLSAMFYPLFGYLADIKYGRFRIITTGFVACVLCFFIQSCSFVFNSSQMILPVILISISYTALCMGSAAIQANILPFACDQIHGAWEEEISSLFHWYYWTRNVGAAFSFIINFSFSYINVGELGLVSLTSVVAASSACLALVLIFTCKHCFTINNETRNPLRAVFKVTHFALKAKFDPFQDAFTVNQDPPPRLDLAKIRYGGPFTTAQVEDVKTFYRLLVALAAMVTPLLLIDGIENELPLLMSPKATRKIHNKLGLINFWDSYIIILLVPIIDQCVCPLLRTRPPSMFQRIGVGFVLLIITAIILAVATAIITNVTFQSIVIVFCLVIVSLGEVLMLVAGMEFVYAQSPKDIKGLMIGIFYLFVALSSILPAVLISVKYKLFGSHFPQSTWYNIFLLVIGILGFLFFLWITIRYKRRRRDDEEADRDNLIYQNALEVLRTQIASR